MEEREKAAGEATVKMEPPRRGKWLKRLLIWGGVAALVLVILVFVLGPSLLAGAIRKFTVQMLQERMGGEASLEEVSLWWNGSGALRKLKVTEPGGETALGVDDVEVYVDVFGAMGGRYEFSLTVDKPTVLLHKDEKGNLNLTRLMGAPEEKKEPAVEEPAEKEPAKSAKPSKPGPMPEVKGTVTISDASLRIMDLKGVTTIIPDLDIEVSVDMKGEKSLLNASLAVKDLKVDATIQDLLKWIHPLFGAEVGAEAGGTFDLSLRLEWNGPIEPAQLSDAALEAARGALTGEGKFAGKRLRLAPNDKVKEVLALLGVEDAERRGDIPEVALKLSDNKIRYEKLAIRLGKHDIVTSGWVGLDGTYAIEMEVPITESMVKRLKKYPVLRRLEGKTLRIPATHDKPVDVEGAITSLIKDVGLEAALEELEDRVKEKVEEKVREKVKEKIREKVGEELEKQLKDKLKGKLPFNPFE